MHVQHVWGWLIAVYLFLGGMGGATMILSYYFYAMKKEKGVAKLGALTAVILVILGTLFLIADLEKPEMFYLAILGFQTSSWVFRGTIILSCFILFGLMFGVALMEQFKWLPWANNDKIMNVIGFVASLFGFMTMTYTGILLGVLKSVPFWNSPALPALFVFSALSTGFAMMIIINVVESRRVTGVERAKYLAYCTFLSNWGAIAVAVELFVLLIYYYTMSYGPIEARMAVEMMLFGPLSVSFYAYLDFVLLGAALLALIAHFRRTAKPEGLDHEMLIRTCILPLAAAFLILIGGLMLRHTVLEAGVMVEFLP